MDWFGPVGAAAGGVGGELAVQLCVAQFQRQSAGNRGGDGRVQAVCVKPAGKDGLGGEAVAITGSMAV